MVTRQEGEIVLDSKRYKLQDPKRWQRQPVVRAARKIGGGDTKYSDYDLWNVKAWETWHLGRGEEYFETDGRYYDSWNCETRIRGQITLGPHIYPTGLAGSLNYESGTQGSVAIGQDNPTGPDYYAYAESFDAPTGGFVADSALFLLKRWNTPGSDITVSLCSDSDPAGEPGDVLKSKAVTAATVSADNFAWIEFDWDGTQALEAATTYWLVVSVASLTESAHYKIAEDLAHGYGGECNLSTATPWSWQDCSSSYDLWFRLEGAEGELNGTPVRFAFYNDDGTEKLFVLAGTKVYYWAAATDKWVDDEATLGGTGTDMQVWNSQLVVTCGANTIRAKSSGSWGDFSPSGQGRKLGIGIIPTGTHAGKVGLIKSGPTSLTDAHKVRVVEPGGNSWDSLKGASADTVVGDPSSDITWIGQYQGSIWIGKEDGVYEVGKDGIAYNKFPFFTQKASWNFAGTCVWHRNELMLPAVYGMWSFDGRTLKNIGPGVSLVSELWLPGGRSPYGEHVGLPTNRQGVIKDLLPTVNALYAAMDAGAGTGYSSILLWTGRGWHEVVRGDSTGKRILALGYTPANTIETEARLWYGYDKNVFYCILPDTTDDPYQWASSKFENQGWVELGWFNAGLFEVDKDWRDVTIEAENVDDGSTLEIFYKLDDDTSYTSLGVIDDGTVGTAISNNQATLTFGTDTYGKRIMLKIYAATDDPDNTPKVTNVKLKYWKVPDPVYGWNFTLKLTDLDRTWRTQQSDFKTTYEKKEPITLVDPYGASHTVRLDKPVETIVASDTGLPLGCLISLWAYEA